MNDTSSVPGSSLLPESTDLFTTANFVLIGVLALLVVLGLLYGARLRRRRKRGIEELRAHNERVEQGPAPTPIGERDLPPLAATPEDGPVIDAPAREPLADEPIAAETPTLAENPAAAAAPPATAEPMAAGPPPADGPVTQLKGLGPKVAQRLAEQGITTVGQLAALTDDEAAALDARMGPFTGRMGRDRWQEQARFLAAGDRAGFEAVFGRL